MSDNFLKKEDYEEPRCLLNMSPQTVRIPVGRVFDKLDEYLSRKDYDGAERHLSYWQKEAQNGNDLRGLLSVTNEQIGLYRKTDKKELGEDACKRALKLILSEDFSGTVTVGTTYINIATAKKAFGKVEEALPLYEKAREVYENLLDKNDYRLGGLYNNMALSLAEIKDFDAAFSLYQKALEVVKQNKMLGETAITYCNLADLTALEKGEVEGEKEIADYLEKAYALLTDKANKPDGEYAFICEKCAPTFGYYGYFLYKNELNKRAREIYERA